MSSGLCPDLLSSDLVIRAATALQLQLLGELYQRPFVGADPCDAIDALAALAQRCGAESTSRQLCCALLGALVNNDGTLRDQPS